MGAPLARAWITAAAWIALSAAAAAQVEGPLDNDAYLPVSALAEAELARGDQAFALARKDPAGASAAWTAACEAWRNALVKSRGGESAAPRPIAQPGEISPWPDAGGAVDRFTEGIEAAVFRRLEQLPPAGRAVWTERFAPLALEELGLAGSVPEALLRVERELPATTGAACAALLLAEIAFERAETGAARAWLARARRHGSFEPDANAALFRGIELRERALPEAARPADEVWRNASQLERVAGHFLESSRTQAPRARALGAGPQAGMVFLEQRRALIQTPGALWILADDEVKGPFEHAAWLGPAGFDVLPAVAPGDGPGWRLDPAGLQSSAVVVAGRSLGGRANVLARVELGLAEEPPSVAWALAAGPASAPSDDAESSDEFEFQPGPLWRDGRIFVLVRHSGASGEREIELRALDPAQGDLLWSTYIGKGGERTRDLGRFARRGVASLPAEPLRFAAGGVFASAQLGFCALVEPLDGRLRYTLRNRRRPGEQRGWTGWGAASDVAQPSVAWAPSDSDHLYVLDASGTYAGSSPLLVDPEPRGEAEALVAAEPQRALVLSRAGARWALARWDLPGGSRQDALHLGPEEVFSGRALASEARVLAASDRALYLFDRGQDLALLAAPTLAGPVPRGGNVWAIGARVYVLSSRYLEIFSAR